MGVISTVILGAARFYGRHAPLRRGKNRLIRAVSPVLRRQGKVRVASTYGNRFHLEFPQDIGWESLYVLGSYEAGTSALAAAVLEHGDIVCDVGANLGWYTMLFDRCVRPTGSVHAFEPVPWIRRKLEENCDLNEVGAGVVRNDLALGASEGAVTLYSFTGLTHGETSGRPFDGDRKSTRLNSSHSDRSRMPSSA